MNIVANTLRLPYANVDTDQIIPAKYLSSIQGDSLGDHLFEGNPVLLRRLEATADPAVLVVAENFGCGSSREHAVWAIQQRGFRVVIAPSFARIFRENAYNNGLLTIELPHEAMAVCLEAYIIRIDTAEQTIDAGNGETFHFEIDPLALELAERGGYLKFVHEKLPAVRTWKRTRG
jgi:3-isopropylmalate/(R)-2-methylmalate dehydratase small subunit